MVYAQSFAKRKGINMSNKKNRLDKAEMKYSEELHEWLTNPKNEDLPNEIVEPKLEAAFNEYLQELFKDEDECAEFISTGSRLAELEFLPLVFEHFKSKKIYEAIKANCGVAFSHKQYIESNEMELRRKELLAYMEQQIVL